MAHASVAVLEHSLPTRLSRSHCIVAYVSIGFAVIARFPVFWPCLVCWPLLWLDKLFRRSVCCGRCKCCLVGKYKTKMRLLEEGSNDYHCSQTRFNASNHNSKKTGKTVRLVLNRKVGSADGASRWVYIQVPAISRCWHPFSLANKSGEEAELLIDVHRGPVLRGICHERCHKAGDEKTWTEKLYDHVLHLNGGRGRGMHLTREKAYEASRRRNEDSIVNVSGPFGSSFSRCFEHRPNEEGTADISSYDVVILLAAGLGLPSALSSLREFIEMRRKQADRVPPYVWFVWQCSHEEDLQLAWDALHMAILDGMSERAPDQSNWRYGLDLLNHRRARNESWANTFFGHENMLDWLGVTIYVSRPKTNPIVGPMDPLFDFASSKQISQGNGEGAVSIERSVINRWLTDERRLRKGYFNDEFAKLLLWLAEDHRQSSVSTHGLNPRICVSMCGAHAVAEAAQRCIGEANKAGDGRLTIDVEFLSETQ